MPDEMQRYEARAVVFKALGHPARLLMVDALAKGERCVCELTTLVGADVSTVSKHLAVLREAGVVESRKEGANVFYRLALACVPGFISCVDAHLRQGALERITQLA
jgi:transcriptional regulator, ArsR family